MAPNACDATDLTIGGDAWHIPARCATVDLSFRTIGPEGAQRFAAALIATANAARRSLPLTGLNLTWTAIGLDGLASVTRALGTARDVAVIDLKGCWLGDDGAAVLAAALEKGSLSRLKELHLRWNSLSERGAALLASALPGAPSLEVLDLGGNWLGDAGAAAVASAAAQLKGLTTLRLDSNNLFGGSDTSVPALERMLQRAASLRTLELGSNHLEERSVLRLSNGVRLNTGLHKLDLSYNRRIGDAASTSLAGALEAHPGLSHVDLRGTTVRNAGADRLLAAFEANPGLKRIDLEPLFVDKISKAKETKNASAEPRVTADRLLRLKRLTLSRLSTPRSELATSASARNGALADVEAYWRQVYPVAAQRHGTSPLPPRAAGPPNFFYVTAPPSLLESGCESHSWALCRLDKYFDIGETPPRISFNSFFSPFRMSPGSCLRNQFPWDMHTDEWRRAYPYSAGVADDSWVEVQLGRYKIFFHLFLCMHESIIPLSPPLICITHTTAVLLRNFCAI